MECMKKGLLTEKETGGLDLRFGNYQAGVELLELIAFRKGFGDFCADGVRDMAKSIGRGSEDFAMHSKGLEFPAYDPRAGWGSRDHLLNHRQGRVSPQGLATHEGSAGRSLPLYHRRKRPDGKRVDG